MINTTSSDKSQWHTFTVDETVRQLNSNVLDGISCNEAIVRLTQNGPNTLGIEKHTALWKEFIEELCEPMVLLLLATGVLYAIWGELADAIIIFIIILALNTVEVVNGQRSKKAIASLRKLSEPVAYVKREGNYQEIPVEQIVIGDLLLLNTGHRIPADGRLVEAYGLSVDESALTGESFPVEKSTIQVKADSPLAERCNMVYSSTLVTGGKGFALVVATGMNTEIGKITGLTQQIEEIRTPLQNLMEELSKKLIWFALGFSVLVPLVGIVLARQPVKQMILTGLSLAYATIPEELPIIITMVLSLGAYRLSKKQAIVKRLDAVETLGSVTVIATDKTGTLTENKMEVVRFEPESSKNHLLEIGMLCNDAIPNEEDFSGDPIETAVLRAAQKTGYNVSAWRDSHPMLNGFSFDNSRKCMSVVFLQDGYQQVAIKGAPETILARSIRVVGDDGIELLTDEIRQRIIEQTAEMADEGMRVLALAERSAPVKDLSLDAVESELTFVGLIGLQDPPRSEVHDAIETCQHAGIQVMMITGDHPLTAKSIGRQVGLDGNKDVMTGQEMDTLSDEELTRAIQHTSIFARTSPEHKLRIVKLLQLSGERVAVTGDGINDSPALSAADIGISMGETGTDIARESSDMVLMDDNFSTIVHAVEEGRLIYENLKKGVRYYLTCKLALVFINLLPVFLLVPVPFAPVQIILMEMFMDLMAAASFIYEKPESDLLHQKPRNAKARFMDKDMINSIFISSIGLFVAVTVVYLVTWYGTQNQVTSQTAAFYSWLIGHVLLAFNMRSEWQPIFQMGLSSNRLMLIWAGSVILFISATSIFPGAQKLMQITALSISQWVIIFLSVIMGTCWMEIKKNITYPKQDRLR